MNKALDDRHEAAIRRFARASSSAQVRELWLEAFEQGRIPGAYWALLTHAATERPLVEEAFGQVHMLSHMVGSSSRVDIVRLRSLERDLGERDEKIARQQARLAEASRERSELLRRVADMEGDARRSQAIQRAAAELTSGSDGISSLVRRLEAEKAHAGELAARLTGLERQLEKERGLSAALNKRNRQIQHDLNALEAELQGEADVAGDANADAGLGGRTLLYVGGRPGLMTQLKAVVARRGGTLLSHDGGVEESLAALPGLISRAHAAFFPTDCVSHSAAEQIKKSCRDQQKLFVPLRTASVANFLAAIRSRPLEHDPERRTTAVPGDDRRRHLRERSCASK